MRNELELMELADRYLRGEMNGQDRSAFEQRMRTNVEIQELVHDHQALLIGMDRLNSRIAVEKAYRSYRFGKWAPWIGGAGIVLLILAGGWMISNTQTEHSGDHRSPSPLIETIVPSDAHIGIEENAEPMEDRLLGTISAHDTIAQAEGSTMYFAEPVLSEEKDRLIITDTLERKEVKIRSQVVNEDRTNEKLVPILTGVTAPEYPGGENEMRKFIYANLKIPEEAKRSGVLEKVTVQFVIDAEGNVTAVKADPGPGKAFEDEAERVIRAMPKWKPGSRNGTPVDMQMALPLVFMAQMTRMQ